MTNKQIVQAFLDGQTSGKANSLFIDDKAIYSYGYHFPLALRMGSGLIAVNQDKYSQTTSCHQGLLNRAINEQGKNTFILKTHTDDLKVLLGL